MCTGDHACIRLSGCPTLTVKTSADPLKSDPVAHATNGCVGVPDDFAAKLFKVANLGDKVIITDGKKMSVGDPILAGEHAS